MDYNYHTHTYRCGHASGTEEEYIQRAIEGGIKYMGFSDHVPFVCDDGYEAPHRVPMALANEYVDTILSLKKKYADKIDIKVGFESEYYPEAFDTILNGAINAGAEYLILGQHFLGNEHYGGEHSMCIGDNVKKLKEYCEYVVSGLQTGYFTYVAHPDMVGFTGDVDIYKQEIRKICVEARRLNIPLEINCLGIRGKRNYPNKVFWQVAAEEKSPVTFGFDAHEPKSAFDDESLITAKALVEELGLNYIGKPNIIAIK